MDACVAESASGNSSELDGVCAAPRYAVAHLNLLANALFVVGFKTNGIVGGIKKAMGNLDVAAIYNVNAIVVPVGFAIHRDAVHKQVCAAVINLVPASRVFERNAIDINGIAFAEVDVDGAVGLVRAVVLEWVADESAMDLQATVKPRPSIVPSPSMPIFFCPTAKIMAIQRIYGSF